MLHTFKPSRAPVKRVKSIQFCIWDPEDIVRSLCQLNLATTDLGADHLVHLAVH